MLLKVLIGKKLPMTNHALPSFSKQIIVYLLAGTIGCAASVQAKEMYLQPSVSLRTEYDDNRRLTTDSALGGVDGSAYAVITRANAKVGVRSNRYDFSLDNQFRLNRYESELDLDSEDFIVNLNASYSLTERSQLGLNGNYTRDTTLTSELQDGGTGLVQDNLIRQQWSVTPNWSYSLSDTQFLQASYTHSEISYEKSVRSSLVDYTIDNISLAFTQQWTTSLSNNLTVTAMSFDIPEIINGFVKSSRKTTEYSVNIGGEYQISPTWSTSLTVGQRFTNTEETTNFNFNTGRFEEVTTSSDVQGLIFSFNLNKKFETGSAGISYSRSTSAQSNGELQVRENIAVNYSHRFTEKLQFSMNASRNETSISGDQTNNNARTNYNVRPSIRWAFDRQASLTAAYQYRTQAFDRSNDEAISNSISLSFNYQWDKLKTQRY